MHSPLQPDKEAGQKPNEFYVVSYQFYLALFAHFIFVWKFYICMDIPHVESVESFNYASPTFYSPYLSWHTYHNPCLF